MNIRFMTRRLFNEVVPDATAGGAAPAPAPASQGVDSILAKPDTEAAAATTTAPAPGDEFAFMPDKFRVMDADGKFNALSSAQKLAESYAHLEKHHTIPAPKPEEYQYAAPESLKDTPIPDDLLAGFKAKANEMGLSQEQFQGVMGELAQQFHGAIPQMVKVTADQMREELGQVWSTPKQFEAELVNANRAMASLPPELREKAFNELSLNPTFIQFAAAMGRDMREDRAPQNPDGGSPMPQTMEALMRHPAFRDPKHPEHDAINRRVDEASRRIAGS